THVQALVPKRGAHPQVSFQPDCVQGAGRGDAVARDNRRVDRRARWAPIHTADADVCRLPPLPHVGPRPEARTRTRTRTLNPERDQDRLRLIEPSPVRTRTVRPPDPRRPLIALRPIRPVTFDSVMSCM